MIVGRSMRWNACGCKARWLGKEKMRGKFEGCSKIIVDNRVDKTRLGSSPATRHHNTNKSTP